MRSSSKPARSSSSASAGGAAPSKRSAPSMPGHHVRRPSTAAPRTARTGTDGSRVRSHFVRSLNRFSRATTASPKPVSTSSSKRSSAARNTRSHASTFPCGWSRNDSALSPTAIASTSWLSWPCRNTALSGPSARTRSRAMRVTVVVTAPVFRFGRWICRVSDRSTDQNALGRVARMPVAIFLPIFGELAEPRLVADLAAEAEDAGWDGVFVWDHMLYREPVSDIADPWITLAAIAMATERVRIGPMVTPLPRRRPQKLARETLSLDRLSGGRLTLGIGLGGDPGGELTAFGEELDPPRRGRMLDEGLQLLVDLWSGENVLHRGEHFVAEDARLRPVAVQEPRTPIWIGARHGFTRPLQRAARYEGLFPVNVAQPAELTEVIG